MAKSRLKEKTKTEQRATKNPGALPKGLEGQEASQVASWMKEVVEKLSTKQFASESEAVKAVANSVAQQVTKGKADIEETSQFLELLIDTDPVLKEELIGCLSVKE